MQHRFCFRKEVCGLSWAEVRKHVPSVLNMAGRRTIRWSRPLPISGLQYVSPAYSPSGSVAGVQHSFSSESAKLTGFFNFWIWNILTWFISSSSWRTLGWWEIRVCNMHGDSWLPMLSKRCLTGIQLSTVWPSTKHYLASGWASVGYRSVLCWKMPDGAAVFF